VASCRETPQRVSWYQFNHVNGGVLASKTSNFFAIFATPINYAGLSRRMHFLCFPHFLYAGKCFFGIPTRKGRPKKTNVGQRRHQSGHLRATSSPSLPQNRIQSSSRGIFALMTPSGGERVSSSCLFIFMPSTGPNRSAAATPPRHPRRIVIRPVL
jgi:hypothetical protein